MKKLIILTLAIFMLTGCLGLDEDDFSDITSYTTLYPLEYATNILYSGMSKIQSIYPNETDVNTYKVTDKQKKKYAEGEIFVYSGLSGEATMARDLLNINGNLKIIDATKGMSVINSVEETWLDPSNFLMLCRNIKSSLVDYTENIYTKDKIEENYKTLKEQISVIDVELFNISKSSNYQTMLVTDNLFNYLSKYNINIISLDPDNPSLDKAYAEAKKAIANKEVKFIYTVDKEKLSEATEKLITDYNLTKIAINPLYTLTNEDRKINKDYVGIMNEILEEYKKELFKK